MNNKIIEQFLKRSFELDKSGEYKKADRLFVKISQYTVGPSSVKWQGNSFMKWDEITQQQFDDNQESFTTKFPPLMPKQYYNYGDGDDASQIDELSTEGRLNGPSGVTGPAAIDPGPGKSPSMNVRSGEDIDNKYGFEENYEQNVSDGNAWKNRIPDRT